MRMCKLSERSNSNCTNLCCVDNTLLGWPEIWLFWLATGWKSLSETFLPEVGTEGKCRYTATNVSIQPKIGATKSVITIMIMMNNLSAWAIWLDNGHSDWRLNETNDECELWSRSTCQRKKNKKEKEREMNKSNSFYFRREAQATDQTKMLWNWMVAFRWSTCTESVCTTTIKQYKYVWIRICWCCYCDYCFLY